MKFWQVLILLVVLPCLFLIVVNETSPASTFQYRQEGCTRYCHNKGCPHFEERKITKTIAASLEKLYIANIRWLKKNPFGLSYQNMNLLLYVLISPVLIVGLLWVLVRKKKKPDA